MAFRSGYVNIIGKPNVGKSTLMNALMGEKLSIVSPKVQTTRHRILGIMNGEDFQVIFSDTPGIIPKPKYKLHDAMMHFVHEAIEDADVVFYMIDVQEKEDAVHPILQRIQKQEIPVYLILNKIDTLSQQAVVDLIDKWKEFIPEKFIIPLSALKNFNIESVKQAALAHLPEHPAYFPEDMYTDKSERFQVSEIIREKIFNNFYEEIPYATEVVVTSFKEEDTIIRIMAEIFVERQSQKGILIGKGGESLKRIGTQARMDMEQQFGKQVFLELYVKVREDWRENPRFLQQFGFDV
ncbi:MAG: GTPase Era [Bacteroidia bacterium]